MKRDLNGRVWLIDELRGLSILLMIVHHAAYDLVVLFGVPLGAVLFSQPVYVLHVLFASLFVGISGMSSRFSHSNLRRGAICLGFGLALTAVTAVVMPGQLIVFGILHLLGTCMMLFALLRPLLDRCPPAVGALVCFLLFVVSFGVPEGYLGAGPLRIALPDAWYTHGWLAVVGLPTPAFASADYFPLVPWVFLFLCGSFLGVYVKEGRCPAFFYRQHSRALCTVGRHTLWIYLLHQPVVYALIWLVMRALGRV